MRLLLLHLSVLASRGRAQPAPVPQDEFGIDSKERLEPKSLCGEVKEICALTLLFHEPLLDRTRTLQWSAAATEVLDPMPAFEVNFEADLASLMEERARGLWLQAAERNI